MYNLKLFLICQYWTFLTYAMYVSYKKSKKKSDNLNDNQTFATH